MGRPTPEEIAELEAGSERIQAGVDKVKAGLKDIRQGLFGKNTKPGEGR